ncbi:hypothetical protein UFOVP112_107 [uncultured Caudovirales phage]|uniref:Uncharacterized protein n=1 Tax=uncultured Caudovirales phage TaxID=2100421 RepID=A0A6J5L2C8_9CAUD|nr:hypothetical protein UFOVP112_107 [uncultured Caudovirales phage]
MIDLSYFSQYDTKHIDNTGQATDNTFSFINNGADNLVVTVGCSWTWGANMTSDDDLDYRLTNNFGRVLSNALSADWLCLGQVGTGNFWLYQKVEEFVRLIPTLKYKKIYIICTLTEVGRQCYTELDSHIDYKEYFRNNAYGDKFLEFLNDYAVKKIVSAVEPYSNVILRIGTNFVDPIGVNVDSKYIIPNTWLSMLCAESGTEYTGKCYTVSHLAVNRLKQLKSVNNDFGFFLWLDKLIELGHDRITLCQQCNLLMPGTGHPGATGHRMWAEHILKTL